MKTKILYIGNKLANKGRTPTTVDTLSKQFEEFMEVHAVSDKLNPVCRLFDMCFSVFRHRDYDYVIIDTYSSNAFYFAFLTSLCCRLMGIKYIPILHGGNLPNRLDTSKQMSSVLFKNSYINVSPSDYLRCEFNQRGYNNVITIPNNIDLQNYPYKERLEFKPRLLWVRAFAKVYNCPMAIEVLRIISNIYPDATLCMVGPDKDGSMDEAKMLATHYGLEKHVTFTGKLTKNEWIKLSEDYDIFISTTNFDNTPVSVIESMALGLPVISTNVGGMPYIINNGKNGFLIPKGDAKTMADAIVNIIQNPTNTMQICSEAYKSSKKYGWESVKKEWQNLISKKCPK